MHCTSQIRDVFSHINQRLGANFRTKKPVAISPVAFRMARNGQHMNSGTDPVTTLPASQHTPTCTTRAHPHLLSRLTTCTPRTRAHFTPEHWPKCHLGCISSSFSLALVLPPIGKGCSGSRSPWDRRDPPPPQSYETFSQFRNSKLEFECCHRSLSK